MARLYADENFHQPVVEASRWFGHDVLTSHEAGNAGRSVPDDEVLAFAVADRHTLLTLNRRHFVRLHQLAPDHAGVLVCSFDPDFVRQAERIAQLLASVNDWTGRLARLNRPG